MLVFVKLPTGCTLKWMAGDQAKIEAIKSVIEDMEGIPVDRQRLVLECRNDNTVCEPVNVTNEIHFVLLPIYEEVEIGAPTVWYTSPASKAKSRKRKVGEVECSE